MEHLLQEDGELIVSIKCLAYNHEPYIRQCLDGFVMQKTNFRFEAIVHDDASTDGTAAIIREYAEKYPDSIKPIFQTENLYSKHDGSITRIMNDACKGKYIAYCEGDDYWTDPLKLQKQVDFMEGHPECSLCFHNAQILNETASLFYTIPIDNREYSADELFREWIVPTASILCTREASLSTVSDSRIINGDINIVLACATVGKVYGMRDCMSVYRVQSNGVTISRAKTDNLNLQYRYIDHYKCLHENYRIVSDEYFDIKLADTYINIALVYIRRGNFIKALLNICLAFRHRPERLMYRLLRKLK